MLRLQVSYSGRVRACKYPAELQGDAAALSRLIADTFELPVQGTRLELSAPEGGLVALDSLELRHDGAIYLLRASFSAATVSTSAGQGILQLLGEGDPSTPDSIVASLLLPTIFSSEQERAGYRPIDSEEGGSEERSGKPGNNNDDGGGGGVVADPRVVGGADEFRGRSYQNQLTKFNRVLAHLVNDRTVLAWFRCNLAFVSLSFKYMRLASTVDGTSAATVLLVSGGVFMVLLPVSWWSGFRRYSKCKELLDSDITRISAYLHKMGFDLDTSVFFAIILLSFVTICYSATMIIWTSSASSAIDDFSPRNNDIVPA